MNEDEILSRTRAVLEAGVRDGLHLGAQLWAWHAGRVVADLAVGERRPGEVMRADDLMLWMSAGKPVAAVAALQQVEAGRLELDRPVAEVLPAFGANGKERVTLRQVLNHTAGFRGPMNNFAAGDWAALVARALALRQEPGWVPGEKAGYHVGGSWLVVGALVEHASGEAFPEYVRRHVFGRIGGEGYVGMSAGELEALRPRVAPTWNTETRPPVPNEQANSDAAVLVPRPGANARGPSSTLGKMYVSLLRDERLLKRSTVAAMTDRAGRQGMADATFRATLDWGLGVMLDSKRYAGEHAYGFGPHASARAFGHGGNQCAGAFADPAHDLVVAWACNGQPGEAAHQARASAVNRAVYEDLRLSPSPSGRGSG